MRALLDVRKIQHELDEGLSYLKDAFLVFRCFFDPEQKVLTPKAACELQRAMKRLFRLDSSKCAPIQSMCQEAPKRWRKEFLRARSSRGSLVARERIARAWKSARDFFENDIAKCIPQEFRRQLDRSGNPFREVWALRFKRRKGGGRIVLPPPDANDLEKHGFLVATDPSAAIWLLGKRHLEADWPQFGLFKQRVKRAADSLIKAGRTDLTPRDEDLCAVAKEIVKQASPNDRLTLPELTERINSGEIELSSRLKPKALLQEVQVWFKPIEVPESRVRGILNQLVQSGELVRVPAGKDKFYVSELTPQPTKPVWNNGTRELTLNGKVIKRYGRNKAANQTLILTVFEQDGWPVSIDDPLVPEGKRKLDRRKRLQLAVQGLNHNLHPMRFHMDGTGCGLRWELLTNSRCPPS